MIAVSYIMKRKIKKIFFEVISNSKIFNINFFQRDGQRPRFSQTYRGGLDNVEYGNTINMINYFNTFFILINARVLRV